MPVEVRIPPAGDSVRSVTVLRWQVDEGAAVRHGTPILEVETDKACADIYADTDGHLAASLVYPGEVAEIGRVVAVIASPGESVEAVRFAARKKYPLQPTPPPVERTGWIAWLLGLRS